MAYLQHVCADNTEIADLYMQKPVTVLCDVIAVTMATVGCEGIEFCWIDTFWLTKPTFRLWAKDNVVCYVNIGRN